MDLDNEQIKAFCRGIDMLDIKNYINNNWNKYQEFLSNRENTN